jgi:hypothetical protein
MCCDRVWVTETPRSRVSFASTVLLNPVGSLRLSRAQKPNRGFRLASVHCRDDLQKWSFGHRHLTSDEARRIANAIARLPEFLMQRCGFYSRGGGHDRWKPSQCAISARL